MENNVDILLIEDNPHEAELAIRSLRKHHLAARALPLHRSLPTFCPYGTMPGRDRMIGRDPIHARDRSFPPDPVGVPYW